MTPPQLSGHTPIVDIFQPSVPHFLKAFRDDGDFFVAHRLEAMGSSSGGSNWRQLEAMGSNGT